MCAEESELGFIFSPALLENLAAWILHWAPFSMETIWSKYDLLLPWLSCFCQEKLEDPLIEAHGSSTGLIHPPHPAGASPPHPLAEFHEGSPARLKVAVRCLGAHRSASSSSPSPSSSSSALPWQAREGN
ncbi:hypothetical protein PGTUg99_006182 [Puccinia graminis f. sp. tritici]|uniref:Uncharacterized protein n=1 Tax=Puccinia graminis f. sp. tritici TaxID=56615 RepID=A0A5B0QKD0_PUCGR|nr:hypothetical protein PGTUg99_006182 [Puccinia graminis f. sp. tritici]